MCHNSYWNLTCYAISLLLTYTIALSETIVNASLNHEDQLHKDIFANYNKHVRPLDNCSQSVDVTVSFVINSLMDIKEREEKMVTVGFLKVIWKDEFLTWNPATYGGRDHLILPADQIWLPDIAISNSVSQFYDITYKRDFHVHISHTGVIRWSYGGIFSTSCQIHLEKYPFDYQHCYIEIENWMYTIQDVNLILPEQDSVVLSQLGPNAVWQFHEAKVTRKVKYAEFASLRFTFVWKRKSLYYYVNIVIPIVLFLLVACGVFWLPAECGEKMSLAISIVLAFSVFQIIIMETTPVNSDVVPSITELVMVVMVLATTSLLTSMLVVYISGKSTNTRAPCWLRSFCFNVIAKILCMQDEIPRADDYDDENNLTHQDTDEVFYNGSLKKKKDKGMDRNGTDKINSNGNKPFEMMETLSMIGHAAECEDDASHLPTNMHVHLAEMSASIQKIRSIMEGQEQSSFIRDEWKLIAKTIDRLAFWITMMALGVSLTYIFI